MFAEEPVNINASRLWARCHLEPKLQFIVMTPGGPEVKAFDVEEVLGTELDNDGNAFVVLLGAKSCAPGTSLIEASLENAPYTTYTTEFTIQPPRPTFPE